MSTPSIFLTKTIEAARLGLPTINLPPIPRHLLGRARGAGCEIWGGTKRLHVDSAASQSALVELRHVLGTIRCRALY